MKVFVAIATIVLGLAGSRAVLGAAVIGDAGAELAHELGLDDAAQAQRAVEDLGTAHRLGLTPESQEPVDEALLESLRSASEQLSSEGPQVALESLTKLTKDLDAQLKSNQASNSLLQSAAEAHWKRASALEQLNKPIEALVEAQKVRSICSKVRCSPQINANNLIHTIEDELDSKGDYAVLQLTNGASQGEASKARKRLMLLLHPDKNTGVDKQTSNYLAHLYKRVDDAHKNISKN